MRYGKSIKVLAIGFLAWSGLSMEPAHAQDAGVYPLEARVWLDRGAEPVLQRGERTRIYYRVSESAFVSIFHIDTNGNLRMVFPSSPQENHFARAGRDYRVLFPSSSYWYVNDDPGIGYFFIVASPEPFDFRAFGYSHYAGGWDLSRIGQQVYGDPYLAMDDYVAALIPEWEYVAYGLDFTSYHVERHYDYPRFMCYDCHGFQPYYSWNPYSYSCTSFRVVIYSDPYYYPATRYRGTRVVYVQPRRGIAHFGFKERAVGEAGTPHVVVRNTPPTSQPGVAGNGNRRAVPRTGAPSAFTPGSSSGRVSGIPGQSRTGVESGGNRRSGSATSGSVGSVRVPSTARPGTTGSSGERSSTVRTAPGGSRAAGTSQRPVLERRPTGSTTTPTRTTRPSSRVVKPRGGGTTGSGAATVRSSGGTSRSNPTVRSSGGTSRSNPTVRSSGGTSRSTSTVRSSGGTSRSNPTVRSSGGTSRSTSTVRSSGGTSRSNPTVRSSGGTSRSTSTVRSSGGTSRSTPTVRSSGSSSKSRPVVRSSGSTSKPPARATAPARTTRQPARTTTRTKPKKPRGGGG